MARILGKKERESIFRLFLEHDRLSFTQIEKAIKIRSNMVAYHLQQMRKEGILEKSGDVYALAKHAEKYLPVLSQITAHEVGPIPVVLVAAIKKERGKEKILLMKRTKRPYKDYWGLIGGKMRLEESFTDAALRLLYEKTGLHGASAKVTVVLQERVIDDHVKHNFILFLVTVVVRGTSKLPENVIWASKTSRIKVIPSDAWLLAHRGKKQVVTGIMTDKKGVLSFKVAT